MVQCRCYGLWNPIYYVLSATAFSLQLPNWIDSWNIYDYCFVLVLSWLFMYRNWRAKLTTHIGTKLPGIRSFFFSSDLAINSLSGQAPRTLEVKCNTLLEERGKMVCVICRSILVITDLYLSSSLPRNLVLIDLVSPLQNILHFIWLSRLFNLSTDNGMHIVSKNLRSHCGWDHNVRSTAFNPHSKVTNRVCTCNFSISVKWGSEFLLGTLSLGSEAWGLRGHPRRAKPSGRVASGSKVRGAW